jgi:predicted NUDIX family NTP pyrophosphohydrolase
MGKRSAGLLMYRRREPEGVEVFLVRPGGPLFAGRDAGVWSVPKGEIEEGEPPLEVARREFLEETGQSVEACRTGERLLDLGSVVQRGGKEVVAWAFEGDWPRGAELRSNTFRLEWPPRSGRWHEFPEVDRAEFFALPAARERIHPAQAVFLDRLRERLDAPS